MGKGYGVEDAHAVVLAHPGLPRARRQLLPIFGVVGPTIHLGEQPAEG
jgi:hypothetical protein